MLSELGVVDCGLVAGFKVEEDNVGDSVLFSVADVAVLC